MIRRRKFLTRKSQPKRSGWIKRKFKPRFKEGRDRAYLDWVKGQPCILAGPDCWGPTDPAHVRSRGAGGVDRGNAVACCRGHHEEHGRTGIKTFQERYGISMTDTAARLLEEYEAQ